MMADTDTRMPAGLSGLKILVVEDEVAISMLLEDMLLDFGSEVVGPAGRLAQAVQLAESASFDLAILDVNLAGEPIYPVVDVIARRGIRFLFSTGYGAAGIDGAWKDRPVLQKPFSQAELERALTAALA
ncbi:response regulator [uncultured Enterovirga sp.]|uniref:response regulator n=1 Tax=uncultured Enterovirga sp. TaxID=2026352 RepID=UPI0035C9B733